MEKVAITGANGFTGRYVIAELKAKGYQVIEIVRSKAFEYQVECDLSNKEAIKNCFQKHQPDYIIHLAALSFVGHDDPSAFYDVNLFATLNILEACAELELDVSKIILSSSANVYGNPAVEKISERQPASPVNHYAMSKLAMEHMSKLWFDKLPILITRPFNYTGAGQDIKFLVPKIVSHFKRGDSSIELGNLDVFRDFSDVRDISRYYVQLLESSAHSDIVNLCSGSVYSLSHIIEEMQVLTGYNISVKVNPNFVRKNEIKILGGDNAKLNSLTSETAKYSLQETLKAMLYA